MKTKIELEEKFGQSHDLVRIGVVKNSSVETSVVGVWRDIHSFLPDESLIEISEEDTDRLYSDKYDLFFTEETGLFFKERRQKYAIDRLGKYPSIEIFADALYWQSKGDNTKIEDYLSLVEIVKNTYPKS
jgi:hypothetical protein